TASLIGTEGGDSCGNSSLETPECEAHGGSSHARGKRPPAVEINSFSSYPKNTHLRTNIYFGAERILGYSTDMSWTSSPRIWGSARGKNMHLLRSLRILYQKNNSFSCGASNHSSDL